MPADYGTFHSLRSKLSRMGRPKPVAPGVQLGDW